LTIDYRILTIEEKNRTPDSGTIVNSKLKIVNSAKVLHNPSAKRVLEDSGMFPRDVSAFDDNITSGTALEPD